MATQQLELSSNDDNRDENHDCSRANPGEMSLFVKLSHDGDTDETTSHVDAVQRHQQTNQNHGDERECHRLLPHIDPGLVIHKAQQADETWLSDFVSPGSTPKSSYSPLAQAVKKLMPERTACRLGRTEHRRSTSFVGNEPTIVLGCRGNRCKYERSDYWRDEQMAIKGIFSHW
jgi:hypothetical protein